MRIPEKTILVTKTTSRLAGDDFARQPRHCALHEESGFTDQDSVQVNPDDFL
jgi:hypothetical protein